MGRLLECTICGTELEVPLCCETDMGIEEGKLTCSMCGSKKEIPLCCGKKMGVVE